MIEATGFRKARGVMLWDQNAFFCNQNEKPFDVAYLGLPGYERIQLVDSYSIHEILGEIFDVTGFITPRKFSDSEAALYREYFIDEVKEIYVEILESKLINVKVVHAENERDIEEITYSGNYTIWWEPSTSANPDLKPN